MAKQVKVTVTLDEEQVAVVDALAAVTGNSRSTQIAHLLDGALREIGNVKVHQHMKVSKVLRPRDEDYEYEQALLHLESLGADQTKVSEVWSRVSTYFGIVMDEEEIKKLEDAGRLKRQEDGSFYIE